MKKWFKMPSEQAFQAMYPPKDDAFDRAVRATLDALPDDGAGRKHAARKVSVVLAVAMLMLALACAAVAAGLGVFGKLAEQTASAGYSELYRALDEKSVVLDETQNVQNAGGQTFRLTQAYVDGESLFVAYELTGMQPTADDDVYLGDSAYLAGTDDYLNILSGEETLREDGTMVGMKEFELPEALKMKRRLPWILCSIGRQKTMFSTMKAEFSGRANEPKSVSVSMCPLMPMEK